MQIMDHEATAMFNQLLRQWRGEGKHIDWAALGLAHRLAMEAQETRQRSEEGAEHNQGRDR